MKPFSAAMEERKHRDPNVPGKKAGEVSSNASTVSGVEEG